MYWQECQRQHPEDFPSRYDARAIYPSQFPIQFLAFAVCSVMLTDT